MATSFFGGAFFGGEFFSGATTQTFSGGYYEHHPYWRPVKRRGIPDEAVQIIDAVAIRQAEQLGLDEQQRFEELTRELELKGITYEIRYLKALNELRERLIDEEIGKRLRQKRDANNMLLIFLSI